MSSSRKQWLLKVIAGPHQGAEISLSAGKTLIGSDDACDVVLHDVLVAPQHVEVELADAGVTAAPLGGRVFLNGKRIREARQSVPDFTFISIGGTHLVIGAAGSKWPLLSAADVPELEKEVEAPAATAKKEPAAEATTPAPPVVVATIEAPKTKPAIKARLGPVLSLALGVILLIAWFYVYEDFMNNQHGSSSDAGAPSKSTPVELVRGVVKAMVLSETVKVEETAGRVTVNGYVDTESRQRELQAAFRDVAPGLHTKIYSLEKIASSARSMIDDQHLPLAATSLTDGKLKVTGTLTSAEPWVRMRQTLLRQVPGLSGIEDSVEIVAQQNGLPMRPMTMTASAPASTAMIPRPSAITMVSGMPAIPIDPEDPTAGYLITASTIDTPESIVATVKTNAEGLSYMRLNTGGIYFPGARLPYGGVVTKIESDTITVLEKGETRVLRLGDTVAQVLPRTPKAKPSSNRPAGSSAPTVTKSSSR